MPRLQILSAHPVSNKAIHYLLPRDDWADKATAFSQSQRWLGTMRVAILRSAAMAHGEKLICCCWRRLGIVQTSYLECWSVKKDLCFRLEMLKLCCANAAKVQSSHFRGGWELERTNDWVDFNKAQVVGNCKCAWTVFTVEQNFLWSNI